MLKEYSMYFAAYLFNNLNEKSKILIEKIILFGSVAKNEATKESDIDIFIEVSKKNINFENEIKKIEENFYKSRESSLFKIKGIENKFSIKVGKLKEWNDLQKSIFSTGIILYSKYETKESPSNVKHYIIIYWNNIGKNRGAFLNKLYGFKIKDKKYEGLIQKYSGKKLGKSCILMPIIYKDEIFKLIEDYQVNAKILEVFV